MLCTLAHKLYSLERWTHRSTSGSLTPVRIRDLKGLGDITARSLWGSPSWWGSWEESQERNLSAAVPQGTWWWATRSDLETPRFPFILPPWASRAKACPLTLETLPHLTWRWKRQILPSLTTLPGLQSGRSSLHLENHRCFTLLDRTENIPTPTSSSKELWPCLLEHQGPRMYPRAVSLLCLEVQGISEVCLSTNSVSGQHSVRGDGLQIQIVGNIKKNPQQMST